MNISKILAVMILLAATPALGQSVAGAATAPTTQPTAKLTFFGVSTAAVDEAQAAQLKLPGSTGLLVLYVQPNSPADVAGLKADDVLLKFDDQLLINGPQLSTLVRIAKSGQEIAVTRSRGGKTDVLTVRLGERDVSNMVRVPVRLLAPMPQEVASSRARMIDKEHDLLLVVNEQGKQLTATALADNKIVFDGPVDTEAQRKALPPDLLPKLEKLEQATKLSRQQTLQQLSADRPADTVQVKIEDDRYTLSLISNAGGKVLKASDKQGRTLFDGAIDTEAQRKSVPAELQPLLSALELRLNTARATTSAPATAPAGK